MGVSVKITKDFDGRIVGNFTIDFDDLEPDELFQSHLSDENKIDILTETLLNICGVKKQEE